MCVSCVVLRVGGHQGTPRRMWPCPRGAEESRRPKSSRHSHLPPPPPSRLTLLPSTHSLTPPVLLHFTQSYPSPPILLPSNTLLPLRSHLTLLPSTHSPTPPLLPYLPHSPTPPLIFSQWEVAHSPLLSPVWKSLPQAISAVNSLFKSRFKTVPFSLRLWSTASPKQIS